MNTVLSIKDLATFWSMLGNIPLDEEGKAITESFLHFPAGAGKEDVWHWFESCNPKFRVADMHSGRMVYVVGYDSEGSGGFDWYTTSVSADQAFEAEKISADRHADEGYTAYRFDVLFHSVVGDDEVTDYIDSDLCAFFVTADKVYGSNPRYERLRRKYLEDRQRLLSQEVQ